jgi:hypothetical protein
VSMAMTEEAASAAIEVASRALHLPTVRSEAPRLAEVAARERLTHRGYLAEVLSAELDDRHSRRRARRVGEARFPRMKRLADSRRLRPSHPGDACQPGGGDRSSTPASRFV